MRRFLEVRYMLIALATVFGIGIAIVTGIQIERARRDALDAGSASARNLANTLAQHARQTILAVDLVLQGLASPDLEKVLIDPKRKADSFTVLRNRVQIVQGLYGIGVLDPQGHVFVNSMEADPEPRDLSDRPWYAAIRDGKSFAISAPLLSQYGASNGKLVVIITRRLEDRDGRFVGTVVASLSLEYFKDFYEHLDIGPRGVISILRRDGIVVMRYPLDQAMLGTSAANSTLFQAYKHSVGNAQGEVLTSYVSDKLRRIAAYREIPDVDLVVTVGLAFADILAPWRRTALTEAGSALAVLLLLTVLTSVANRLLTGQEGDRERFEARLNRLAAASTEIASIHTGAALIAGLRRIVHELIPGSEADVRFAVERTGVARAAVVEARRITVPLQAKGGRVLGTLDVSRIAGPPLSRQDVAVLSQLALIGTVALENVELLAESNRLAAQAERARAEEAEARHRIEDVFATMSEGIYTLDRDWRFTFLNDNAVKLILRKREELLGNKIWDALPDLRGSALQQAFESAREEQTPVEFEFGHDTGDGTVWTDVRAFPTRDGLNVYIRDITQRVDTEGKLRQSQKMEAIGQLTGGIAHDFNNLLTVVLGNIDLLTDALAENARLRRLAEVARDAAMRGATLVARLLAFARRQALAPRPVDINQLTHSVEDLLRRTIGETVRIELKLTGNLWKANIDPTQMENALLNLALNARDAMPIGGTLTIETTNTHLEAGFADDTQIFPGDYVMVAVSDTGTGMTTEVRSRAFDPFFTTKAVGEGSGLGLSMVYGFVRQSGGYVRIDSEVGHGTTVRIFLPRAAAAAAQAEPAVAGPSAAPKGHETILLVEDDELVREHLVETLKSLGYAIVPCGTGREAIDIIRGGARADLLLTDVMLAGGMNGHGVAERIKQLRPDLPVLYMSGYTDEAIVPHGRIDGGIYFISKPFRRQEIAAKLREVLSGVAAQAGWRPAKGDT